MCTVELKPIVSKRNRQQISNFLILSTSTLHLMNFVRVNNSNSFILYFILRSTNSFVIIPECRPHFMIHVRATAAEPCNKADKLPTKIRR